MKAIGIQKAQRRLRDASRHLDRLAELAKGLDVPAFEYEWFLALSAINSAHEILRTSAWKNPKSKQWFSSADKHIIRKDQLLRYILHARGVDHHGINAGTAPDVKGAEYLGYTESAPVSFTVASADGSTQTVGGGAIILAGDVHSFSFGFKLVPVVDDRDGEPYSPPQEHLDQRLTQTDPVSVARLAVAYYVGLADEALGFING
jgi:hypothetical protein